MQEFIDRILTVRTEDPDDARRRRLLNILMGGMFVGGVMVMLTVMILIFFSPDSLSGAGSQLILPATIIFVLGTASIYFVNRRSGKWAAFLFLMFLTLVLAFSDTPEQLIRGRSLLFFAIPITVSSLILAPSASFIFATISSAIVIWIALSASLFPNPPAIIGFYMLAMVSWLTSRSLDQALKELRGINSNLDTLVAERTQALATSLAREHTEAGQRRAILNSIADGVIVFDIDRKSILANPAAQNLLMRPVDQIVGLSFEELVNVVELSSTDRNLLLTMMDTRAQLSSFRVEWGKRTLSVNAALVQDTDGHEIGTVTVFRDVTRETELERAKSAFIAIVSHELRTPLNAIIGFAEMLKEEVYGSVTQEQVDASNRILTNSRHMFSMVGDLLDQAQIEAGKLRIATERFRPAQLLKNVQDVMSHIVTEKGLTLTGEIDPLLPDSFMGDSQRLQQILMNLVNNAVKFTDRGNVNIRIFSPDPGHWVLEVRDTGRGIPTEQIRHVFDPFYQVDATATRQQRGFGLGLSIVKQLVGLMEGKINVESTLGVGTTFTITLPLKGGAEAGSTRMAGELLALIIEDDADLAAIFAEAVKAAGFEAQVIRDGALAQRRIKEVVPDIVILDLHLPHVDGPTLLKQIRDTTVLSNTIVIVATADALVGELYRDIADIVLIKPVSFIQLRDLCARLYSVPNHPGEAWAADRNNQATSNMMTDKGE